jgi:protein-disulfide isomerase
MRILTFAILSTVLVQCSLAQSTDELRRQRIADNLQLRFEQLRGVPIRVTDLTDAGVAGFDLGTLLIDNQNQMRFLVTKDDTHLYLLAADAVDVSQTSEEIAAERERQARAEAVAADARHQQLLALIPGAPSLGNPDAPVTIVEFSDFQCPYCARVVPTVKELLERHPQEVRLVYMHLPLGIHPWAETAAIAAECVVRQSNEAFWQLHDYYFEAQGDITPENIAALTRDRLAETSVDLEQWDTCSSDATSAAHAEVAARVRMSVETASGLGANGTPAFFINGLFMSGAQPLSDFEALVQQAMKTSGD